MSTKTWEVISDEADYIEALCAVLKTWRAMPGTIEYQQRDSLLKLIGEYEQKNDITRNIQ
jgi:hypothetical protein